MIVLIKVKNRYCKYMFEISLREIKGRLHQVYIPLFTFDLLVTSSIVCEARFIPRAHFYHFPAFTSDTCVCVNMAVKACSGP